MTLYELFFLDLSHEIQDLLGTAHGKGRDHQVAAPVQGLLEDLGQLFDVLMGPVMGPVAVGTLHDHIIRFVNIAGVFDQRLILVSDVAGEHDLLLHPLFLHPYLDGGRPQKVAHIGEADPEAVGEGQHIFVMAGDKMGQNALGVVYGVERLHLRLTGTPGLPVLPFRLHFLDMGAVL